LDEWTAGRQRNAAIYDAGFAAGAFTGRLETPKAMPGYRHIYNQYVVRVKDRDALREFLGKRGIGTEIYYPVPLHLQECFAYLGYKVGDFAEAERAARDTLALPIYPELERAQLDYVISAVGEFVSSS
jgi:dTDP-4-amino-4,6-dideoxygalactose transaminase